MANGKSGVQARINRTTGVSSNANGARGSYLVSRRGSTDGARWGNRMQKYNDIRRAMGLSAS